MPTKSNRISQFRRRVRKVAAQLAPSQPPPQPPPVFRPISGYQADWPMPRLVKAAMRVKRRRETMRVPMAAIFMKVTKQEKMYWERVARDLQLSRVALIRLGMRYFLGSRRMQRLIAQGERTQQLNRTVSKKEMWTRVSRVIGTDDARPDLLAATPSDPPPPPKKLRAKVTATPPPSPPVPPSAKVRIMVVPKTPP